MGQRQMRKLERLATAGGCQHNQDRRRKEEVVSPAPGAGQWQLGPLRRSCVGEAGTVEEPQAQPEILAQAQKGEACSGFSPPPIGPAPANDSNWPRQPDAN